MPVYTALTRQEMMDRDYPLNIPTDVTPQEAKWAEAYQMYREILTDYMMVMYQWKMDRHLGHTYELPDDVQRAMWSIKSIWQQMVTEDPTCTDAWFALHNFYWGPWEEHRDSPEETAELLRLQLGLYHSKDNYNKIRDRLNAPSTEHSPDGYWNLTTVLRQLAAGLVSACEQQEDDVTDEYRTISQDILFNYPVEHPQEMTEDDKAGTSFLKGRWHTLFTDDRDAAIQEYMTASLDPRLSEAAFSKWRDLVIDDDPQTALELSRQAWLSNPETHASLDLRLLVELAKVCEYVEDYDGAWLYFRQVMDKGDMTEETRNSFREKLDSLEDDCSDLAWREARWQMEWPKMLAEQAEKRAAVQQAQNI